MEENQHPEEASIKEAASANIENIRQAAGQKADELREAAQGKAQELKGAAENARSQAKSWHTKGEVYVRANPNKAVLMALGLGFLLGLLFRK